MDIDPKLVAAARAAFPAAAKTVTLGAPIQGGACAPEPLVQVPLAMLNRHGLIAGATGTGKTKTLQLMAEQISAAGTPVFLADLKGDLSGLGVAGEGGDRVATRARETGFTWKATAFPIELVSLTGPTAPSSAPPSRPSACSSREGARPERDPGERPRDGLQVLRRPRSPAPRLPICAPSCST